MSEYRDTQSDIVAERELGTAERCRNLLDGTLFMAEYEENPPIELRTELEIDPREAAKIYVSDKAAAAKLKGNQPIAILLLGTWVKFTVLAGTRENNPGNPQVKFGLALQTEQDQ